MKDYSGTRCGRLVIMSGSTWSRARARCRCGEIVKVNLAEALRGRKKCCGSPACRVRNDLMGKTFGRLRVIGRAGQNRTRQTMYRVRCVCGKEREVTGKSLQSGNTTSCGCRRREQSKINESRMARKLDGQFTTSCAGGQERLPTSGSTAAPDAECEMGLRKVASETVERVPR
jgi:hypothetical protein